MNWVEARRKLLHLAKAREMERGVVVEVPPRNGRPAAAPGPGYGLPADADGEGAEHLIVPRAHSLCIGSGKGGTGKSVVAAALAHLFASRGRTLIVDADLGVGNAHILQDVSPERTFVDVVEGRHSVRDCLVPCSARIDLIAAGSGVPRMADLSGYEMHLIAHGTAELEQEYRYLLIDSAAGISRQTMSFAQASDVVLIVTTPDLTAMTDAYAFLKVLYGHEPGIRVLLIVNRAADEEEATRVFDRIGDVSERFLGQKPRMIGWIPEDPMVTQAVNRRSSVVARTPGSPASRALRILAVRVIEELGRDHPRGLGRSLLRKVGFSSRLA